MYDFILQMPLWQIIRSFGLISYALLSIGICLGILYSYPIWSGTRKAQVYKLHILCAIIGTGLGLLHGLLLIIDPYMPFSWGELLLPFTASHHPVLNGLGTLAGFGSLVLIFTSDLRKKLKKKIWFAIHLMSYPIFAMAFIHGFFVGTDSANLGLRWMYFLSVIAVLGLTVIRGFVSRSAASTTALAQRTARH